MNDRKVIEVILTAACFGHGVEDGYVMFDNGVCIRGKFAVELPEVVPDD